MPVCLNHPGRDPFVDAQTVSEGVEEGEAGSAVVFAWALADAGVEGWVLFGL